MKASSKTYQNAIRAEINHFSRVFLVIDGLDTMSDRDRFLNRMQKLPEHAQLFITLRKSRDADVINQINISTPEKDIKDYIINRLRKDNKLSRLGFEDESDTEMHDDIVRYVAEKSHGM